jgi:hypothetical protein
MNFSLPNSLAVHQTMPCAASRSMLTQVSNEEQPTAR